MISNENDILLLSKKFTINLENWKSFIRGDFNASTGVVTGKIVFTENIFDLIPFASGLTFLSTIGNEITDPQHLL